jgi:hypothetical protein
LILHSVQPCGHVYIPDETSSRIQSFPDETKNVKLNKGAREVKFKPPHARDNDQPRPFDLGREKSLRVRGNAGINRPASRTHRRPFARALARERTHTPKKQKKTTKSPSTNLPPLSRAYTSVKTSAIRVTTTRTVEPGNYPGRARVNQ